MVICHLISFTSVSYMLYFLKNLDEVNKPELSLTAKLLKKIIHLQFVITINLWNVDFLRCRNRLETFSLCGKLSTSFQLTVSFPLPSPPLSHHYFVASFNSNKPYLHCDWTWNYRKKRTTFYPFRQLIRDLSSLFSVVLFPLPISVD